MEKLILALFFLVISAVTIREPIEVRKAIAVFKVQRIQEYKNIKPKDYTQYLKIKETPAFKIPEIRYSAKEYDIKFLPWGEAAINKKGEIDVALGFQFEINF